MPDTAAGEVRWGDADAWLRYFSNRYFYLCRIRMVHAPTLDSLQKHLSVRHGQFRDVRVNLYAIVRDEIFLMPAFFDHYRRLGVEQFLILDDGSQDGTLEFLRSQPDCVVLSSDLRFDQEISVVDPAGKRRRKRGGNVLKPLIPRTYLRDKYALYVDADEFLVLPDRVGTLSRAFEVLKTNDIDSVAANLVEFYPEAITDIEGEASPESFDDLVRLYPFFDAHPLIEVFEGEQPRTLQISATDRLFRRYGIGKEKKLHRFLKNLKLKKRKLNIHAAILKTPIIRWRDEVWLRGSHRTNIPPTNRAILSFAHFKYTHDFHRKMRQAMHWKSHDHDSRKYFNYNEMLRKMREESDEFLCNKSVAYAGPGQLEQIGLLKWELPYSLEGGERSTKA